MSKKKDKTEAFNLLVDSGVNLLQAGYPKLALDVLRKAEKLDYENAPLQHLLGMAALAANQEEEAERHWQWAVKLDPHDSKAFWDLFRILITLGKNEEALQLAKRAAELRPDNPDVWTALAEAYLQMDKPAEARQAAEKGLDLIGHDNGSYDDSRMLIEHLTRAYIREGNALDGVYHFVDWLLDQHGLYEYQSFFQEILGHLVAKEGK